MAIGQAPGVLPHGRCLRMSRDESESCEATADRRRDGRSYGSGLIELRRRKFVVSQSLTTLAVSLLICACMILEVRADSQSSFRKVFSTEPLADPNAASQRVEHGGQEPKTTISSPSPTARTTSAPPSAPTGSRQPRATTRRRSSSTTTTTTASSAAGGPSTSSPAQTETEPPVTSAPKQLISARTLSVPNKKLTPEEEAAQEEADAAAAEAEEAERAAARRRRLRNRKKLLSLPNSPLPAPTEPLTTTTTTSSPATSSSTTARAPTSRRVGAAGSSRARGADSPSSITKKAAGTSVAAAATRHTASTHPHQRHFNASDEALVEGEERPADEVADDLDYDDEFGTKTTTTTTRRKPIDLDKVKLLDADHHNETHAGSGSISKKKKPAQESGLHANETTSTTPDGTLAPIKVHEDDESSAPLDPRSPGVGKRLTDIIAETRGRLRLPSTPAPGSSTRHFTYSKPTSTTEMPPSSPTTLVATTPASPAGLIVQVMNQTAAGEPTGRLVTLNETAGHLDWSKLVKVMFKSARDNQTIYTLVMNSSELSNHPISDWSNELPGLLRRDFEKLKDKWLHVFPDLMTDLATIIISKHPINGSLKPSSQADPTRLPLLKLLPSSTTPMPNANGPTTTLMAQSSNATTSSLPPSNQTIGSDSTQTTAQMGTSTPMLLNFTSNAATNSTSVTPLAMDNSTLASGHLQDPSNGTAVVQYGQQNGTSAGSGGMPANQLAANQSNSGQAAGGILQVRQATGERDVARNKSMDEMIQDIRDENMKIEDDVREQGSSLKHFIIICSISTVVATSLVVALILLLLK